MVHPFLKKAKANSSSFTSSAHRGSTHSAPNCSIFLLRLRRTSSTRRAGFFSRRVISPAIPSVSPTSTTTSHSLPRRPKSLDISPSIAEDELNSEGGILFQTGDQSRDPFGISPLNNNFSFSPPPT